MNLTEAMEQLSQMSGTHNEEIELIIDCPHCGRSGPLASLRPMIQVTVGSVRSDAAHAAHVAELRRISMAVGLPWPSTVDQIVNAIRHTTVL